MRPHHTLDRSTPTRTPAPTHPLTPRELARLHNRYVSAIWRGDDVSAVGDWLDAHLTDQAPPEPDRPPDAVSIFGGAGAGAGIRWYLVPGQILGYRPGPTHGCYRISISESLPMVPSALQSASARN